MTDHQRSEPSPRSVPGVRLVVSPVTAAVALSIAVFVLVVLGYHTPRVLAATGASWLVGVITYLAARRR